MEQLLKMKSFTETHYSAHPKENLTVSHIRLNPRRNHITLFFFLSFFSPSPQWWMSSVCLLSPNVTSWLCSESWWIIKALVCPLAWPLQCAWSHKPDWSHHTVFPSCLIWWTRQGSLVNRLVCRLKYSAVNVLHYVCFWGLFRIDSWCAIEFIIFFVCHSLTLFLFVSPLIDLKKVCFFKICNK